MIRATFGGIAAIFLIVGCDNASKPAIAPAVENAPAPAAPSEAEVATFEEAVANFDGATQHLVWVLPPGIIASGPFTARVVVKADDATELDTTIPLTSEKAAGGSRPEYPAGAEVLRLSTDASYPQRLEEIRGVVDGITSRLGPGHGELAITSDFKTEIDPTFHKEYCVDQKLPPVAIYLEQGEPSTLRKLPIGGAESILQATILAGCANAKPAP
jgi:hypothetical protein